MVIILFIFFLSLSFSVLFPNKTSVKNCFIRGSVVRYVSLPPGDVDTSLLQDATRREAQQPRWDIEIGNWEKINIYYIIIISKRLLCSY